MAKNRPSISFVLVLIILFFVPSAICADATIPRYIQNVNETAVGLASWYSENDPGINKHTANMEIFDDSRLTAAMWDVPFDQLVKVTNLNNGKSVIVRINDRGRTGGLSGRDVLSI